MHSEYDTPAIHPRSQTILLPQAPSCQQTVPVGASISLQILYCVVLHSTMFDMDRSYRIPQFGTRVGRSAHPLRVMDRNGTYPARGTATGRRYHTEADAQRFPGGGDVAPQGLTVVCCRVSSRGQREDLKRPVPAMEAYGPGAGVAVDEWRSEVGGGLRQVQGVPVAEGTHREAGDRPSAGGPQGPSDSFRIRPVRAFRPATRLHHHGRQPGEPVAPGGDGRGLDGRRPCLLLPPVRVALLPQADPGCRQPWLSRPR